VSGTPTLFFSNGKRVPGAITDEEIGKMIAAAG
jgi:protein-disulfide isomerase